MKRRLAAGIVVMIWLAWPGLARAADTWALLVGVSKYSNNRIQSLQYPAADVTALRDTLLDPQLGALPPDHILLLADGSATGTNINNGVDGFLKTNVKPGDGILIFLAGHGVTKGVGPTARSYFLPSDVQGLTTERLDSSAVELGTLSSRLSALPAGQFVVFVDACREDPAPGRGLKGNPLSDILSRDSTIVPQTKTASSLTFFACQQGERAYEEPQYGHGVFAYWIMDAIRQGAVPTQPGGAVEMGRLATYVSQKVSDWAKSASSTEGIDYDQTPIMVAAAVQDPVILMHVERAVSGDPVIAAPARVDILPIPDSAQVSVNGESVGMGPLTRTPGAGEYKVQVEAPQFRPYEMEIKLLDGYDLQLPVDLTPTGATGTNESADAYTRALAAIGQNKWPEAEENLGESLTTSPMLAPAYLQLCALYLQQNRNREALGTLLDLVKNIPPDAHTYAVLSHAYAVFAIKGPGDEDKRKFLHADSVDGFRIPGKAEEAAALALKAARAGADIDPASVEAQLALGFSLVASDPGTKNKEAALDAFEKAVAAQPSNADAHFGLGYALRVYAPQEGKKTGHASRTLLGSRLLGLCQVDVRRAALLGAVDQLTAAIRIRPDFFEARRELAYLYHLLDDDAAARRAYEEANCRRGHASDRSEVAAMNIALSALYRQESRQYRGRVQRQWQDAAKGYLADAHDYAGDTRHFKAALNILKRAGLASRVCPYLPQAERDLCEGRNSQDTSDQDPIWLLPLPGHTNDTNPNRPTTNGGRPGRG